MQPHERSLGVTNTKRLFGKVSVTLKIYHITNTNHSFIISMNMTVKNMKFLR